MAGSIYTDPTAAAGHSGGSSSSSSSSNPQSILSRAWDWLGSPDGVKAAASVIGGGLASFFGTDRPDPTGYQGKIPDYTFNRQALPIENDPNRRPGEYGRRYFTDGTYASVAPAGQANGGIASIPPATGQEFQGQVQNLAEGGLAGLKKGRYLRGHTDGMADEIPTSIDGKDPAALSHGEFVIPADVVSHLGNGNSEAGAKVLEEMMARIRKARTGKESQGKEIDPNEFLPV